MNSERPPLQLLFIGGASRSGTTVMAHALKRSPAVHTFTELHFLERLWDPANRSALTQAAANELLSELQMTAAHGIYGFEQHQIPPHLERVFSLREQTSVDAARLYEGFLFDIAEANGARVACEHTPSNALMLDAILDMYPNCRVIMMVRDPRDVLLSQRRKWRRRWNGAREVPLRESIRSAINYHPRTTATLWRAATEAILARADDERVEVVRFEDLLAEPEMTMRRACDHVGIDFTHDMLRPKMVGSSTVVDKWTDVGFDPSAVGRWKGHLSSGEVRICEQVTKGLMPRFGYDPVGGGRTAAVALDLIWPAHAIAALSVNRSRSRQLLASVQRRLGSRSLSRRN